MVEDLAAVRTAPTRDELHGAYAEWMKAHSDAWAWELRSARAAFRSRRAALAGSGPAVPPPGSPHETTPDATTWLADWFRPEIDNAALEARLAEECAGLRRSLGRGSAAELLAARDDWFRLQDDPAATIEVVEKIRTRISTPDPEGAGITLTGVAGGMRARLRIRNAYPQLVAAEPAFFAPYAKSDRTLREKIAARHTHAPPEYLTADDDDVDTTTSRPSGQGTAWLVIALCMASVGAIRLFKILDEPQPIDRLTPPSQHAPSPFDSIPGWVPSSRDAPTLDIWAVANDPDVSVEKIEAFLLSRGLTEAELRRRLAFEGISDPSERIAYRSLLRKLDRLRLEKELAPPDRKRDGGDGG